jgi:long-chain acyl-CoA synthetase
MAEETLAQMFWNRVERHGDRPAQLFKVGEKWESLTWRQYGETVRELALGLLALGRKKGEAVALLSQSRAEWAQADFAILSAGCVTVPIYPSYVPEQIAYIVNDSEAKTIIVENAAQLAKVGEARGKMDRLDQVIVMEEYETREPTVYTWEALRRIGRENAERFKSEFAGRVTGTRADDVATVVYTSGTTGPPKGVIQTHDNHMAMMRAIYEARTITSDDLDLLFLPLAHSYARCEEYFTVYHGCTTAFAENLDKVGENLRETHPTFLCSVPRVFEKVYARILAGVDAGSPVKKKIFNWAIGVGREVSRLEQAGKPIPAGLKLRHRIAHKLVFHKLHEALGGRLRFAVSGGAPLSKEIAEFFHAAGILILEGYGLTETCPSISVNRVECYKFGTVGIPYSGIEVRIAHDGEILVRGRNIARGYWKKPEATAEAWDAEGWFHTGDIGEIDSEGFLKITDRKKDLIITAGGMNIAPQNVENLLKTDPFVSQAMVYGDRRPYPVALITLNQEELAKFAKGEGILTTDPAELAKHPRVRERVGRIVEQKNEGLQSYAKIKKFAILPADFTQEGGDLTPTLKVKRKVVAEKYRDAIESLYG